MIRLSKKNINDIILSETKGYKNIYHKKDLMLNEDVYVQPTSPNSSSSNISSDLSQAKSENPTKNDFTIDGADYDNNANTKSVTIDVQGKNPTDAEQNFNTLQQDPNIKNIKNKNFRFHLESLRRNSIPFSKKEINEMIDK